MANIIPSRSSIDSDMMGFIISLVVVIAFISLLMWDMAKQYGCPSCGHISHPKDVYCAQCGKLLRIKD